MKASPNTTFEHKQAQWSDHGKAKAAEYSSIPFDQFARNLLKEISIGINYIPNAIAVVFTLIGAIYLLIRLPSAIEELGGISFLILLFVLGLGIISYRLFLVAKADYYEERKRKIINGK